MSPVWSALRQIVKISKDLQKPPKSVSVYGLPVQSAACMWFSISRYFTSNLLKPFAV